ncbi:MAG: hypothetical protein ACLSDQ_09820 [Adlercreutzia equolifaciens]
MNVSATHKMMADCTQARSPKASVAAENLPCVHRRGEKARHGATHALGDERHAAGNEGEHEQEDADEHRSVEVEHPPVLIAVEINGFHVLYGQVVAHIHREVFGGKRFSRIVVEEASQRLG